MISLDCHLHNKSEVVFVSVGSRSCSFLVFFFNVQLQLYEPEQSEHERSAGLHSITAPRVDGCSLHPGGHKGNVVLFYSGVSPRWARRDTRDTASVSCCRSVCSYSKTEDQYALKEERRWDQLSSAEIISRKSNQLPRCFTYSVSLLFKLGYTRPSFSATIRTSLYLTVFIFISPVVYSLSLPSLLSLLSFLFISVSFSWSVSFLHSDSELWHRARTRRGEKASLTPYLDLEMESSILLVSAWFTTENVWMYLCIKV